MKITRILIALLILTIICPLPSTVTYAAASDVIWLSDYYDYVNWFSDGYATVTHINPDLSTVSGVIDKSGKLVIPVKYADIGYNMGDGLFTTHGSYHTQGYYDIYAGKEILPPIYEIVGDFQEGLAWVRKDESFSGPIRFGFIDRTGEFIIPLIYESASNFNNGFAVVKKDGEWYLIDKLGQVIKSFEYDNIGAFIEGIAYVSKDGKIGYIDTMGNEIAPPIYESLREEWVEASDFHNGVAVVQLNGKRNIIDKTGKQLFDEFYDYIDYYAEGLFTVGISHSYSSYEQDYKYGLIDVNGKKLTECEYSLISFEGFQDGLAIVYKGGDSWRYNCYGSQKGFIDKTGKEVIPAIYDDVSDFSDGIARVQKDEKWYLIDKTGKSFSYPYDTIGDFHNGLALVSKSDKWGVINKAGKEVVPLIYDSLNEFTDGLSHVTKFEKKVDYGTRVDFIYKTGCIDKTGKVIIPIIYDSVHEFSEGLAAAMKNNKWGFIDKTGKEVIPFIYDFVDDFNGGVTRVKIGEKYGILSNPIKPNNNINTNLAKPTSSKVLVNGKEIAFEAYNIKGNNYFKLRDIAKVLNNSEKSFEVTWDGSRNAINLLTDKTYTSVGGELNVSANVISKDALPTTSRVYINNEEVKLEAYTIGGYNYFKLRDLGQELNFDVKWDANTNSIKINTTSEYKD